MAMSRQMRQFALVSLAGVMVMAVVLTFFYHSVATSELEAMGERQNAQLARAFSNTLQNFYAPLLNVRPGMSVEELRERPEVVHLQSVVRSHLAGLPVLKIKIYLADGLTVFSTEKSQIGEIQENNEGIVKAREGETVTSIIYRDTFNAMDGVVEKRDLIQTYFPIRSSRSNEVKAVFEVYSDVTPLMRQRASIEQSVVVWVVVVLGVFYIVMFLLFRNMDRALAQEEEERNKTLLQLEETNQNLERRVDERTRDLAASYQFLQSIIDGVPDPVMVIDLNFRVTSMNDAARRSLPADQKESSELRCFSLSHGRNSFCEGDQHPCPFYEVLQTEQSVTVTHEHVDSEGNMSVVEVMASPLRDKSGKIIGIIEVTHDISELFKAIKLHQRSEKRFRDIAYAAGEYIWETDTDGRYTFLTDRVRSMLGYSPEDMLGKKPVDFMPEDEAERIIKVFEEIEPESSFHQLEHRSLTNDGRIIWQSISRVPIRNDDGEVVGYRGAAEDITRRKEAQGAMERSETRLRTIMENVADCILTCDENGIIEDFNPATERVFGYRREELIGEAITVLMDDSDREKHPEYVARYIDTGEARILGVANREHVGRRSDGTQVPIDLWVGEMWLGEERKFVSVIRDITERKKAETELEEARQKYFFQEKMAAVGQVAAGIIHEVGNPIAAVSGMVDVIDDLAANPGEDREASDQQIREFLKLIREHTERLTLIIREIADFTHPKPTEPQILDINELIRSVARLLQFERRWRNVEIKLDLDVTIPALMGKADQLTQVVMNLLINALDACLEAPDRAPEIEVTTRDDGGQIILSVSDNGVGMSDEVKEHAFNAFYTTKPVGKGTGLGLSLCHSIVSGHGGTINLLSESGSGTTVRVELPVESQDN